MASLRPEARIALSTSTAPGSGWTPSGKRRTSVPSASKTNPRTSSSRMRVLLRSGSGRGRGRAAVLDERAVLLEAQVADRRAAGDLVQKPHERVAGWVGAKSRRRALAARGLEHRVDLLGRHRQAQQQLLVGDAGPEPLARAVERERLEPSQLLRPRRREHAVGDAGIGLGGRTAELPEEVDDDVVGDLRIALAPH